jgi:hypothetical protein
VFVNQRQHNSYGMLGSIADAIQPPEGSNTLVESGTKQVARPTRAQVGFCEELGARRLLNGARARCGCATVVRASTDLPMHPLPMTAHSLCQPHAAASSHPDCCTMRPLHMLAVRTLLRVTPMHKHLPWCCMLFNCPL